MRVVDRDGVLLDQRADGVGPDPAEGVSDRDLRLDVPGIELLDEGRDDPFAETDDEVHRLVEDREKVGPVERVDVEERRDQLEVRPRLVGTDAGDLLADERQPLAELHRIVAGEKGPDGVAGDYAHDDTPSSKSYLRRGGLTPFPSGETIHEVRR
jgi:hypothetical protein